MKTSVALGENTKLGHVYCVVLYHAGSRSFQKPFTHRRGRGTSGTQATETGFGEHVWLLSVVSHLTTRFLGVAELGKKRSLVQGSSGQPSSSGTHHASSFGHYRRPCPSLLCHTQASSSTCRTRQVLGEDWPALGDRPYSGLPDCLPTQRPRSTRMSRGVMEGGDGRLGAAGSCPNHILLGHSTSCFLPISLNKATFSPGARAGAQLAEGSQPRSVTRKCSVPDQLEPGLCGAQRQGLCPAVLPALCIPGTTTVRMNEQMNKGLL